MKLSHYNILVDYQKYGILYNSFTESFLLLANQLMDYYKLSKNNIFRMEQEKPEFYSHLVKGGFVIEDSIDEKKLILEEKQLQKYNALSYSMMINPTLDCNLSCWYCFENHKPKSTMSHDIIDRVVLHAKKKYQNQPYERLDLSFFGGEPLLKIADVIKPLIIKLNEFANDSGVMLKLGFTTNGTLITKHFLEDLKHHNVTFQITIDGDKLKHDLVRRYKLSNNGSFNQIVKSVKLIDDVLDNYFITLRINYDDETLDNFENILDCFSFLDKRKYAIHLNRVWQIEKNEINIDKLIRATNLALDHGIIANLCVLHRGSTVCYADRENQLLINYDGNVFKCSSRDFIEKNSEGILLEDGTIEWNHLKHDARMKIGILDMCKNCKLLPSCPRFCSQTILEAKENDKNLDCYLKINPLPFKEYIAYNYKRNKLYVQLHS